MQDPHNQIKAYVFDVIRSEVVALPHFPFFISNWAAIESWRCLLRERKALCGREVSTYGRTWIIWFPDCSYSSHWFGCKFYLFSPSLRTSFPFWAWPKWYDFCLHWLKILSFWVKRSLNEMMTQKVTFPFSLYIFYENLKAAMKEKAQADAIVQIELAKAAAEEIRIKGTTFF